MITDSYCGSFPHSLLSTSKFIVYSDLKYDPQLRVMMRIRL